jgi:division protein 1
MGAPGPENDRAERGAGGGMPPGLAAMFAAMLNPANARSGDAVYSQEALDQIISTLMEQHTTSNAPGPAPPDAIAALPKKKLDYEMLGPEGKGECSVCMDDVTIGVEVVVLPCSHWFHEACAAAWLGEHNTCPICRKGLDSGPTAASSSSSSGNNNRRTSTSASPPTSSRNNDRSHRLSATRLQRMSPGPGSSTSRNEARLESIRDVARMSPMEERAPRRWGSSDETNDGFSGTMPGAFHSSGFGLGRRPSEMSENQRDGRRSNTSGSDRSSRRSSHSQSGGGSGAGGAINWLRDRWGSGRRDN